MPQLALGLDSRPAQAIEIAALAYAVEYYNLGGQVGISTPLAIGGTWYIFQMCMDKYYGKM